LAYAGVDNGIRIDVVPELVLLVPMCYDKQPLLKKTEVYDNSLGKYDAENDGK